MTTTDESTSDRRTEGQPDDLVCIQCQGTGLESGSDANDGTTWLVIPCWDCKGTGFTAGGVA